MTRVTLIHVGDFRESYLREAQREYEKRLSAFCDFRCVGVKEEDAGSSPAEIEKALRKEGEQITALLPRRAYVYALCVEDGPTVPYRGVVEGFYGTPWSHEDRLSMIEFCG